MAGRSGRSTDPGGYAVGQARIGRDRGAVGILSDVRRDQSGVRHQADPETRVTARPMPATPSDLFAFLDRLGIAHATVTHPALFTVEQSRELRGTIPGAHTKNLFLKDKKGARFLVTALEDAVMQCSALHRRLAASGRFSFG